MNPTRPRPACNCDWREGDCAHQPECPVHGYLLSTDSGYQFALQRGEIEEELKERRWRKPKEKQMKIWPVATPEGRPQQFNFWCPGCKLVHGFDARSGYNGQPDRASLNAPIVAASHHPLAHCISQIWEGEITFAADCAHSLAGQTVPLEEPPAPTEAKAP